MKKRISLAFFGLILGWNLHGQTLKKVSINKMVYGYCFAKSSIRDTISAGGYATSENAPRALEKGSPLDKSGVNLILDSTIVPFEKEHKGMHLYLANNSGDLARFSASDSRLDIIAEAEIDGQWLPIEYLPESWCGNSYHFVYLQDKEYWRFEVPFYEGEKPARIRYQLSIGGGKFLYSNTYFGGVNPGQFNDALERKSQGLMDPYGN